MTETQVETPQEKKARLEADAKRVTEALAALADDPEAKVPTIKKLREATEKFFELHWNAEKMDKKAPPSWQGPAQIVGGKSLPNFDKQGCYVFATDNEVVTYVGVGVARVGGIYRGRGISNRFHAYCKYVDGVYQAVDPRLKAAGNVWTIGFEIADAYLALALEAYLIRELTPHYNQNRPGS